MSILYVAPYDGSLVTAAEIADSLSGTGIGFTGYFPSRGMTEPPAQSDGTYEVCTFGPAGDEHVRQVLRCNYWRVVRVAAGEVLLRHDKTPQENLPKEVDTSQPTGVESET